MITVISQVELEYCNEVVIFCRLDIPLEMMVMVRYENLQGDGREI